MKTYTINNTILEFEEIYYVDSVYGLDTNDGLTPQTAFKTIEKYTTIAIDNTGCILADGVHVITNFYTICSKNPNYEQSIIGTGLNTKVITNNTVAGNMGRTKPISFYRFELSMADTATGEIRVFVYNSTNVNVNMHWYNVAFKKNSKGYPTTTLFYWISSGNNTTDRSTINNCLTTFSSFIADATNTNGKQTNNIVSIIGNNATTNLVVPLATIPEDYFIVNINYIWKYRGTGENPDNTRSSIGVYGGLFAWDGWNKAKSIDIKLNAMQTPFKAERILVEAISENTSPIIYACNNANDTAPTWEIVENNIAHTFTNTLKTALTWAISVRFVSPKSEIPNQKVTSIGIGYD